ncbi:MAG TPA: polysaccharide biosynthesis/export family protein [Chitinophagaceae bacterium]|nr:polysaccharide biosynthesis/export family protein [Chitinophagaceae bacterium]
MKLFRILLLFGFSIYLISCSTQQKLPNYLENATDSTSLGTVTIPELRIQKNDLLYIQVYSSSTKREISDAPYNLPVAGGANGQSGANIGFLVDINGNIEYPQLGTIHAEGLTKLQLEDVIKQKINAKDSVLTNPSVIIRFLNYKVTVLGQVGHEGVVNVQDERLTILEAIGLAGGINDYGKKNNVKVVREIDGKREVGVVDLSSRDLFESPYYNLMQNDYVIVYPTTQKAKIVDQSIVAQRISLALSVITAAAFIYNIFK